MEVAKSGNSHEKLSKRRVRVDRCILVTMMCVIVDEDREEGTSEAGFT